VALSADGRFVAFTSQMPDLVPDDTNGFLDVFVHDMRTGATTRVSVATGGRQASHFFTHLDQTAGSFAPAISADGRYVAFDSNATDLVPDDTDQAEDVFVHDRLTGVTTRVSVATGGGQASGFKSGLPGSVDPAISANGRYVAFTSDAANLFPADTKGTWDVFEHDRLTGVTRQVSVATDGAGSNVVQSVEPAISADGRYIAFVSDATNLVPHDTNRTLDVFLHDARTGRTERVSVLASGAEIEAGSDQPAIAADGCCVSFAVRVLQTGGIDVFVRLVH
jgi:Tol biopolymer transport system component